MKALLKVSDFIDRICGVVLIILFSLMTVTYFGQIVSRYLFQTGFRWTEELTRYADVWAIMIGAAMIAKRKTHINVSVLEELLPQAPKERLFIAQRVVSLVFFSLMFWFSFDLIRLAGSQLTTNMRIPKAYVYAVFPPAFALFVFQTFVSILEGLKEMKK